MARVPWRPVRAGTAFEREDREHNERLAEELLCGAGADDFVIAVSLVGWRLVPRNPALAAEKWPMLTRSPLTPDWAVSVAEQERDLQRSVAVTSARQPQRGEV